MNDAAARENFRSHSWKEGIDIIYQGACINVLKHPDYDPGQRTYYVYMNHVPTMNGTASYDDVSKALDAIKEYMVNTQQIGRIIVVGDQQTFSRMVWLKRYQPDHYAWCIPFPGEFHFVVHVLMAIHLLWWTQLVGYVVQHAGVCQQSIDEKWDSVEKYNRHRFFYETLIVGCLEYVKGVVPEELMRDPAALLDAAESNKGT